MISTCAIACALFAGVSGVAEAKKPVKKSKASTALCGTTYTAACTAPTVTYTTPSPQCVDAGPAYKLPDFKFAANAGLAKVEVVLDDPQTIKTVNFTGTGPTQYTLKGVTVPTTGLAAGAHHVTVSATDDAGKNVSKTLRFTICQTKPAFTG